MLHEDISCCLSWIYSNTICSKSNLLQLKEQRCLISKQMVIQSVRVIVGSEWDIQLFYNRLLEAYLPQQEYVTILCLNTIIQG